MLEPEVMDTAEEARDYDAMDHAEVNARFCDDVLSMPGALAGPGPCRGLDVGTGTALIPIELCKRAPNLELVAIDLAAHMLELGRENVARAGLASRLTLALVDAKAMPFASGTFTLTISNSIAHHIPEPARVLAEMWRVTASGGLVFIRDLARPSTDAQVDALVARYGGAKPDDPSRVASFENQRALFRASLCAALTTEEVAQMVAPLGISASAVRMTSDRHWTLALRKP